MSRPAPGNIEPPSLRSRTEELLRLGLLTGFALWLAHPFMTSRLIGSGDAWWYGNMLRDFLEQLRHGIFPVWVGQTPFAFNGAVYPLRAAPYYQTLAGAIDFLTGRRFDAFALQHATVVVTLLLSVHVTYFAVRQLAPNRRTAAALLSAFYAACPGVLGLVTSMDLYMSFMATPYLPLVTCGLALSLHRRAPPASGSNGSGGVGVNGAGGWRAQLMIVIGLALAWYAHAPLAAWLTLITAFVEAVRLGLEWHYRNTWREVIGGAVLLAGLVAAVFVSVDSLRWADSASIIPYAIDRAKIISALRSAFPGCLLPVGFPAVNLSDLQLGYVFWGLLVGGGAFALRRGHRRLLLLAAPAAVLVIMILPVPGITAWLWNVIPESLARLTYYWPMQRLVPVLAALALPLGMEGLARFEAKDRGPRTKGQGSISEFQPPTAASSPPRFGPVSPTLSLFLLAALGWSAWQAGKLVGTVEVRTATAQMTAIKQRPENAPLMDHAYGLSLKLPPYFSNGVMDPWFELRVLDHGRDIEDNASAILADDHQPWRVFRVHLDANPGIWDLSPHLTLRPGRRQLLEFDFGTRHYAGTLQIEGAHFFRQYLLPASGESQAFGSKPSLPHWLPLWTTTDHPEEIRVRFIPGAGAAALAPPVFARFRWHVVNPRMLPLRIESFAPLRLSTSLRRAGLLETFRMYFPGYHAKVDGRPAPVKPSPYRLVAVSVPAGVHTVEIDYRPPWALRLAIVVSALTWLGLVLVGVRHGVTRIRSPAPGADRLDGRTVGR